MPDFHAPIPSPSENYTDTSPNYLRMKRLTGRTGTGCARIPQLFLTKNTTKSTAKLFLMFFYFYLYVFRREKSLVMC